MSNFDSEVGRLPHPSGKGPEIGAEPHYDPLALPDEEGHRFPTSLSIFALVMTVFGMALSANSVNSMMGAALVVIGGVAIVAAMAVSFLDAR